MFKIASWNVNSLRVRLPQVLTWLQKEKPSVLALQETKLIDDDFPIADIESAGYQVKFSGQKTYNGVAILSRHDMSEVVTDIPDFLDRQRRVIGATIDNIRVLNLYVPNGESVGSDKYQYKLSWLQKLISFLKSELKKYPNVIVLGDFNIAPANIDVHAPAVWEGKVLFSELERKAFAEILLTGFEDCFRLLSPDVKEFSWWDYRLNAFKRNMGLRIDHVLASQPLSRQCKACYIDKTPRSVERPSDHAPVVAEFKIS
ncbi:MAG: exodeoxyribonuclease III [Gammaproteobacteria bacterium RIFCSPHIGHO2_12_FULL_43_28]|nr:MAG: exodeoxyribonuclease III [Gammaproteobacteria bacterium RIFCSPHIGHO2_12_FULL_43_28]